MAGSKKSNSDVGSRKSQDAVVDIGKVVKENVVRTGSGGLTDSEVEAKRAEFGFNEVEKKKKNIWRDLFMRYLQPIPVIMIIAIVLSAAIQPSEWLSFGLLTVELNLLVFSAWRSELNTNDAMSALEDGIAPQIDVKRNGSWVRLYTRELVPGDIFLVKGGVVAPADALLIGDEHEEPVKVDESSLTGEALLATKHPGDSILSGSVIKQGELEAQVLSTGENTMFGKSLALLGGTDQVGRLQKLTTRLQLLILVCGIVIGFIIFLVLLFHPLDSTSFGDTVRTVFVVVIAGAPVTLPVVVATILAVGARELAREKAVVTRLSAIEELAGMDVLCSDKTGTLTLNELLVDEPWLQKGVTKDELFEAAVLSARKEGAEAIDLALFGCAPEHVLDSARNEYEAIKFVPFNPSDKKTLATVRRKSDNAVIVFSKGSPDVINRMCHSSNPEKLREVEDQMISFAARGLRTLGVARKFDGNGEGWTMLGLISLFDPPRHDTAEVIAAANQLFVDVKMITGDQQAIAIETCARLGMGTTIMGPELWKTGSGKVAESEFSKLVEDVNGFAGVYPEHKFAVVEQLQKNKHVVGMTGDGVNDAPALKKADVGIAVAGATEAAKGAADIILSEPGLGTIVVAIRRARKTFLRLNFYVVYRIWASAYNYIFFLILYVGLRFRIPAWCIVLVSLLKDIVVISTSKDKVPVAEDPQSWNMVHPTIVALLMATTSVITSILYSYAILPQYGNWWHNFHVAPLTESQSVMAIFLQLVQSFCLTVLSTRSKGFFLDFKRRPSLVLLFSAIGMPIVFTFFAVYLNAVELGSGPEADGCGWGAAGITWAYSIISLFVAEGVKLGAYYALEFDGKLRQKRKMQRRQLQKEIAAELLRDGGLDRLLQARPDAADFAEVTATSTTMKSPRDNDTDHFKELEEHVVKLETEVETLRMNLKDMDALRDGLLMFARGQVGLDQLETLLTKSHLE
uniref:Plasma membrane ATPase n=1 Tax=Timspurckia oligopyrenoides TaxID=708627 RepID=A0A7S0ZGL6_9RHOD|mmetsp:Transcript_4375/g.7678  ORF Transcript_4375/g.7678 Transcript_4375/m.7678 type:complete len:969 (+) Transcript_4375:88-2994(+)|eukprot:CAMPEP_0182448816 /NCGR_PEP_ID=MMETSP1172-20130603/30052_1 /TAXON_ID=708627 /ORGANISM="Timspurckia oligopyrenoides, Strain CCMP3278" /LENGTH=968 /DNA_ID=CAMNT_0024645837 /DNA_START=121 /DNA_END=3027 /DNA_ORIENTATION=-